MKLDRVYHAIMEGRAILVTGAGAHVGALNLNKNEFPTGGNLAETLYRKCGIEHPDDPNDLQDASECYLERKSVDELILEIKDALHVANIQEEHKKLYVQNWQRVYTTNYDEIPILGTKNSEQPFYPVTLSDNTNLEKEQKKQCVYINGYIGKLNADTMRSEFRLTGSSYDSSEYLNASPWGSIFADDLATAECIVIVGLSLKYDLDLRRLIYAQNVTEKIVFIERQGLSEDQIRKLKRYGEVYPITMQTFVQNLENYKAMHLDIQETVEEHIFSCFEIAKKRDTRKKATAFDVYNLLMTGNYDNSDALWHQVQGKYDNLLYREYLDEAKKVLKNNCKILYLHANLGNGKTIFIESLKQMLFKDGYHIFELKTEYQNALAADVRSIVQMPGKKIVIIENYFNWINVLKKFSIYMENDIQFILTARTVVFDARIKEANDVLDVKEGESRIIGLNKLSKKEIREFSAILSKNGMWGKLSNLPNSAKRKRLQNKKQGNAELQSILVDIVNSSDMKNKIEETVEKIKSVSESYYEVLILALLIKIMSLDIVASDIGKIIGINTAFDSSFIQNENVLEILDFSDGTTKFRIKSAVTANLILKELDCNHTIIKVLKQTAIFANRYRSINRYENVLKNIISYSHVSTFLVKSGQKQAFLVNYYDCLKDLEYYCENTFFWLQYAIACSNIGKYDLAQRFLDNAYSYFRDSEYTVPFQVDTQQARLYLLRIEKEREIDVVELFRKAHLLLMKPVISNKDNEEKQIILFNKYVNDAIKKKIPIEFEMQYRIYCGEAYNKVADYLKKSSIIRTGKDYRKLMKKLQIASVPKM